MQNGIILLLMIVMGTGLALPPSSAQANAIIRVTPDGSGDGSSWANAAHLQDALTPGGNVTAMRGDEIWIAAGIYTPGTDRGDSFWLLDGVALYGGFTGNETSRNQRNWRRNESILSGEIGTPGDISDNVDNVVNARYVDGDTILDGVTVTRGNSGSFGGGIYIRNGNPAFTHIILSNNRASLGGGMFIMNSSPTLTNVIISGNQASYGGGIYNDDSGSPILTNVTITGNWSPYGAGMYNDSSDATLINVTISGNYAETSGGMRNTSSSHIEVQNSIIWGNRPDQQVLNSGGSTINYRSSLVQNLNPGGTGNLNGNNLGNNPLFVGAEPTDRAPTTDGDYRLQESSPAIDRGDNSFIPSDVTTDLAGNQRLANNTVDLGAYEWQDTSVNTPANTLLLVYAGADNALYDDTLRMFADLEAAANNPNVTIVGMLDGPEVNDAAVYRIKHVPAAGFDPREYSGSDGTPWSDDSADPEVLAAFINSTLLDYPDAEQVLLVISGHGSGISAEFPNTRPARGSARPDSLSGILLDRNPEGASLSTAELGRALHDGLEGTGHTKLDGIYLDACLMGMIEVGYEVRTSADYLLASSGLKWSVFAYQEHVAAIDGQRSAQSLMIRWLDHERQALGNVPHTYALLDLSQMENLRHALDNLIDQLEPDTLRSVAEAGVLDVYDQDSDFRLEPGEDSYIDLGSFLNALNEQSQVAADAERQAVVQALDAVVQAQAIRSGNAPTIPQQEWSWTERASGLSIYAPLVEDEWQRGAYTANNFAFAADSQWDEVLTSYWQQEAPEAPPACTGGECGPWAPLATETPPPMVWLPLIVR